MARPLGAVTVGGRVLAALLGVAVAALLAVLSAGPAAAHATVVSSTPQEGATVEKAPDEIVIRFSEPVSVVAADTAVTAPDGEKANSAPARAQGEQIRYELRGDLPEGTYMVGYRVISADGHPVPGGFTFSIGEPSTVPQAVGADDGSDRLVGGLVHLNRYLSYAGLLLALGPALLLFAGDPGSRRGALKLTASGLCLVAGTAVIGLYLQAPYSAGTSLFGVSGPDIGAVLASRQGGASMVRLLLVLIALPLLRHALSLDTRSRRVALATGLSATEAEKTASPALPGLRRALVAVGACLVATWPFAGHATTSPAPPVTVVAGTIHLAGAALWLGGLVTLLFYLVTPARITQAQVFLPTWSRWASRIVAALAIAGLAQALIHIGTVDGLISTAYGWLVMAKAGLFAALLVTAALARRTVRRSQAEVAAPIRRFIVTELVIGLLVLGVTTALVQAVPAQNSTPTVSAQQTVSETLETELYTLRFELEPGAVGKNEAHLYLFEPDGVTELGAREWSATYGRPKDGIALVPAKLSRLSASHQVADLDIPQAGEWTFEFTIRVSKLDRETATTVVSIT